MINLKGRLQRLNRAVNAPGEARDDWEILRDLIHAISGSNGLYMIEDVFKSHGRRSEGIRRPELEQDRRSRRADRAGED